MCHREGVVVPSAMRTCSSALCIGGFAIKQFRQRAKVFSPSKAEGRNFFGGGGGRSVGTSVQ